MSEREEKAYTTFEAAKICHVTHHSIKNWIKQGLIKASRTPGGHYRILESDLDSFREQYDMFPRDKGSSKKRVMIVDDDPDALALMEKILTDEGFELIASLVLLSHNIRILRSSHNSITRYARRLAPC